MSVRRRSVTKLSEKPMQHPILINRNAMLAYGVAWTLAAAVQLILLRFYFDHGLAAAVADSLVSMGLFAGMALSFWFPCKFLSPEERGLFRIIFSHMAGAVVATLIWAGLLSVIFPRMTVFDAPYLAFFTASLPWRLLLGMLFYGVMTAIYYVAIYYQNFHQELIRQAELRSLIREAELKTLKFQINPHFIFNSLNSLNALILENPDKAGEMTVKLAQFLRITLSGDDAATRPLSRELDAAHLYLEIEKVRFGEKIRYRQEVAREHRQFHVPVMLLQPLLENAVKHGVYESLEPVQISLNSQVRDGYLVLTLENDLDPSAMTRKGAGVGLTNIRERLTMLYRQNNLLQTEKTANRFRVKIFIPTENGLPAQSGASRESSF